MERLKLTVSEEKTRICKVPNGEFDFPGYSFGRMYSARTGQARLGYRPSKKSIKRPVIPGAGRPRSRRKSGSHRTRRWRKTDSNHRSRSCERRFSALPIGDGGTKGGATHRFWSEPAMLAWSGCPQPFPLRRDREFESVFLQRRVDCEPDFALRRRSSATDTTTRATDEALQVSASRAAFPLNPQPDPQPFPALPSSPQCQPASCGSRYRLSHMA
jgi:hypothetical protein